VEKDPKAVELLKDFERMRVDRSPYESAWNDIRNLVRPNTVDFYSQQNSPGDVRTDRIYDGTAMQSNTDLGNAVHTFIANPSERNFGIKVTADRELNKDPDVLAWCDEVSDIIGSEYQDDRTKFTSSMQEGFLDLAFGTITINQEWNADEGHLEFEACPLADCFFEQDAHGKVNRLNRRRTWTVTQITKEFPDATWEGKEEDSPDKKYTVVHCVYEGGESRLPYSSCWVLKEKCVILKEGGYRSFPFHVGRWAKSSEETYGRGPAINCLPEIKMLNRMEFTIIKAWQKAVDPPLIMPSDGFIGKNFRTHPGAVNYSDPSAGEFQVQALEHKGKLEGAETKSDQKREFIRRAFYADWVKLMPRKERQTAYEISELVEQQLRMMAPMLGRLQTEVMIPCIQRSYQLMSLAGLLPQAPPQLRGRIIEVDYVSAAARAQAATRLANYNRYIQSLAVLQPFAPEVMDALDTDDMAQDMAILSGVPRSAARSPEEIMEIRSARAQEQQMMAMADAAPKIGKTMLDLSKANAEGGLL
jgi:hypothetical protein